LVHSVGILAPVQSIRPISLPEFDDMAPTENSSDDKSHSKGADDETRVKNGDEHDGSDKKDDGGDRSERESGSDDKAQKKSGKKPLIILGFVVLIIAIVGFVWWFLTRNQETTDDAFTDGNAVTMAARVGGYVDQLNIRDNGFVKKGDLLIRIDPRDYAAKRDGAQAQLGLAQATLQQAKVQLELAMIQYPAQLDQARAQESSAQAALDKAALSYRRQHQVNIRATTQENVDAANAQLRDTRANLKAAQAQVRIASQSQKQIDQARTIVEQRSQQVARAHSQLAQAELDLSYTEVRAPSDGWVTRRNVQLGALAQPNSALFTLVTRDLWIVANFKESQLKRMRVGDHVDIEIDAYPDLKLRGHVDSIQRGSGSRFSAFPAENATGNFVKIVQRVPVKIVIDSGLDDDHAIPLGVSVDPTVMLR
jgi:membrane fusion protein (multidrug efflux system)